jgi:quinol monooxygenase YgiN
VQAEPGATGTGHDGREETMSIHMTAEYRARPGSVERCLAAIREFVGAIARDEPGTRQYVAWQDERDPVHFLHHFVFENESAEQRHRTSEAVRRFTAELYPETVSGVHFTRYHEVATNHLARGPA